MKIDECIVCGQYNCECESADDTTIQRFEKIHRKNEGKPNKEKQKSFRRPPNDKMLSWEYTK